ncbi:TPM domain-containing protein [Syntrophus gentianae]|uniref:TPM domain-containing protein n=1 Tax=Syntrophus gentianae TaxID=43775 RepID=UPI001587C5C7|nr:TPM domain-containing protein [Syntrophus gentianae]
MNRKPYFIGTLRKIFFLFLAGLIVLMGSCPSPSSAQDSFPSPRGAVNDFAGVISGEDAARMEALSREVLEKTGASVVVATFPSIGDADLNDYANRLYSFWGIGKKGEDRGVLIVLALQERKIRIETGYGVEGVLPDGRVGEILDQKVLPLLKKGEYSLGLVGAVTAVSVVLAGEAGVTLSGRPEAKPPASRQGGQRIGGSGLLILLLLILPLLLGTRRGREMLPLILMMLFSGSGRRGSGGGDFDGFGGFGGGFGGFGGGSSGGGGASRDF